MRQVAEDGGGETMVEPWTLMNRKRAAEYLYTARTLTADEAESYGLINKVVPRVQLDAEVEAMAAGIARALLSTLMGTKSLLVLAWEQMGMRQHLQISADVMSINGEHVRRPGGPATADGAGAETARRGRGVRPIEGRAPAR